LRLYRLPPHFSFMDQQTRASLVTELTKLLVGGNAHATFEQAIADLPAALRNHAVPDVPYTIWHLVEHIRIAQWDIVEFCLDPKHESPEWPKGYPPKTRLWTKPAGNPPSRKFSTTSSGLSNCSETRPPTYSRPYPTAMGRMCFAKRCSLATTQPTTRARLFWCGACCTRGIEAEQQGFV
jgi:hypothetical protein